MRAAYYGYLQGTGDSGRGNDWPLHVTAPSGPSGDLGHGDLAVLPTFVSF